MKLIIGGSCGRMGGCVASLANQYGFEVTAGFDVRIPASCPFPVYDTPSKCLEKTDVIIDFSNPGALNEILSYAVVNKTPIVLATTGYTAQQLEHIDAVSETVPVFMSANMSIGINLLLYFARKGAAVLGRDFDIEIIEKHHKMKVDAPSGTALMIAGAVNEGLETPKDYIYGRTPYSGKREDSEIGIHAVRGGTIIGEHDLLFAGNNEMFELRHTVTSREVFAVGALRAGAYLIGKPSGKYDMNDLIAQ